MSTEQMDSDFLALWKVEEESLKARHYSPVSIGHECCKAYAWWQQSRAALVVELPPLEKYYGGKYFSTKIYAADQFATDVNLAIRAAGITVKEG